MRLEPSLEENSREAADSHLMGAQAGSISLRAESGVAPSRVELSAWRPSAHFWEIVECRTLDPYNSQEASDRLAVCFTPSSAVELAASSPPTAALLSSIESSPENQLVIPRRVHASPIMLRTARNQQRNTER